MPRVSVVMSVYNGEQFLSDAVDSILTQTFRDFEFIIIDDGSTDGTATILDAYADPRIARVRNRRNIGLTKSLNRGLEMAVGEYVARMDVDNVALPARLERQVSFLDSHPEVGLIGTAHLEPDESGQDRSTTPPTGDCEVRWHLLFDNCIDHSSCLLRRALLEEIGPYDEGIPYAQDYDLFSRISSIACIGNLPERLTLRRPMTSSISILHAEEQAHYSLAISRRNMSRVLGRTVKPAEADRMRRLWTIAEWLDADDISRATVSTQRLLDAYCAANRCFVPPDREIPTSLSSLRRMVLARVRANAIYYLLRWVETDVSSRPRLDMSGTIPDDPSLGRYLAIVRDALDDNLQYALAPYLDDLAANWDQLKWRAWTKSLGAAATAWRAERDDEVSIWLARAASLYVWAPWQIANALPEYASDTQGHADAAAIARYLNIVDAAFRQAAEQVPQEHNDTLSAAGEGLHYKAIVWCLETARAAWDAGEDDAMQDALVGAIRIAPADAPWQVVNALRDYGSDAHGQPDNAAVARYLDIADAVLAQATEQLPQEHKETLGAARKDLHYKPLVWCLETMCDEPQFGVHQAAVSSLLRAIRIDEEATAWWIAEFLRRASADAAGEPCPAALKQVSGTIEMLFAAAANRASADEAEAVSATWQEVKTQTAVQDGR